MRRGCESRIEGPQKSGTTIKANFQFHLKSSRRCSLAIGWPAAVNRPAHFLLKERVG
jgi:hypothetical protein